MFGSSVYDYTHSCIGSIQHLHPTWTVLSCCSSAPGMVTSTAEVIRN
jgi:hypothetical protein